MLVASITIIDYSVLAAYLLLMILIGGYFSRQQRTSKDFFLAGRSMGWFPVGLSLMATLLSALSYTGIPGEAYKVGLNFVLYVIGIWLTVPVMLVVVMPLYHRLNIYSVYEYLEFRFNLGVRFMGSAIFIVWRLLWLGGVLFAPVKVVVVATGMNEMQQALLIVVLGAVSTGYTYLGGMKAVIWTDVIQTAVMVGGIAMIVGTVWINLDGGAARVWEVAGQLERTESLPTQVPEGESFWSQEWLLWSMLPHAFLASLSFYIADQITAQRFLTTKSLGDAKRSFILNSVSASFMVGALTYVGLAMLAFYQENHQEMRPYWTLTMAEDPSGGKSLIDPRTGKPYIDKTTDITAELEDLITAGAILDPNRDVPLHSAEQVTDPATGAIVIDRLAKQDQKTGELLIQRGYDELMPNYIANFLPSGVAGLIFAALLAASMSSMDSGLNSISTLAIADFYRRLEWGRGALASWRGKEIDQLDEVDEFWLGRRLVLVIGVAATLFSLWVSRLENIFTIMISVCNTFGAPLLAVFFLGMFTRRTNAEGAMASMIVGLPMTIWLAFGHDWGIWPFATKLDAVWAVTFGVLGTMTLGYGLSFVMGRPKSDDELRGLALGAGPLGVRS